MGYYDGTKLLSLQDVNGNIPEIYISTGNRSSGKTTYFNRYFTRRFLEKGEKFGLLYRYNYELDQVGDKFFKDIQGLFFKEHNMTSKSQMKGIYHELFLNDVPCGYAISINSADQIKKNSHLFSDITRMLFDEFQSETNRYCDKEIEKFISIHTSIARGQGKQVRYVPVYMISNKVSLLNPYFVSLGISERLREDTKFLRGDGFVLEQNHNEDTARLQQESPFNKAFSNNQYINYSACGVYLNDNKAFIEKPNGNSKYICTIKINNESFSVRSYQDLGIMYCDSSIDESFPLKLALTTNDHDVNYVMLRSNQMIVLELRYFFEHGCFRFRNLACKNAILKLLSY